MQSVGCSFSINLMCLKKASSFPAITIITIFFLCYSFSRFREKEMIKNQIINLSLSEFLFSALIHLLLILICLGSTGY